MDPESQHARLLFLDILSLPRAQSCDAILLSGGLDTSIAAEAMLTMTPNKETSQLRKGITVTVDPSENELASKNGLFTQKPEDVDYATAIAQKLKLNHHILRPTLDELLNGKMMELCVRVLRTFEGMELRNAVVIATALSYAKSIGCKRVCTGDGADELFAGYSFMHGMDDARLRESTENMARTMKFCAFPLAKEIGIEVWSPYLEPDVIAYAVSERGNTRQMKVGEYDGEVHGKLVLRKAFPEVVSASRTKAAIEYGSGSTVLGALTELIFSDAEFEAGAREALERHDVVVRTKEHLAYFRTFRKVVLEDKKVLSTVPRYQKGPEADGVCCPDCKFRLRDNGSTNYCDVCGLYPVIKSK
ncbi:hypothetical protein IW140_005477 [Coemansia sp. RSA 1813]|nr:hypothetical protein EV178_005821 [Coemansia sp. RSA 1646]KAJ1768650.1 hypothetical protein LPJ74_004712 [Coemansia sp. RSA 1843]KAJ2211220.1 hypothetical protein EV179_005678 [Coemansia sp. RSA 487]KAJ2565047.1 hypothetical protein IW140_005477 [Coemansia sp. RSA 1813]